MIGVTLGEVSDAIAGSLSEVTAFAAADDLASTVITGVSIDSRTTSRGDLFVAIAGDSFDGHDFVDAALARGAVAAVVSRHLMANTGATTARFIAVDDTVVALGRIAHHVRSKSSCTVIAITGSSGKTTTKDMLAQVLAEVGPTIAPMGSFNNEIGVPTTVLEIDEQTEFLVLEMGARGLGHIEYLCSIARPDVAVVLNVGAAHVGEFGSSEITAQAKGELVAACSAAGVVVLNADDPRVSPMAARATAPVMTFGARGDVAATEVHLDELGRPAFVLEHNGERAAVALTLSGEHQVSNALAVACVALGLGQKLADIAGALGRVVQRSSWRMEVSTSPGRVTVINDAYNANPESMAAALKALHVMGEGRRTWAVLGEMRELGATSGEAHRRVGALAVEMGVTRLVVVGDDEGVGCVLDGARRAGLAEEAIVRVLDVDAASDLLGSSTQPGDVVLIKASRALGLERVATNLLAGPAAHRGESETRT